MEEYTTFFTHHWMLSTGFVAILVLLLGNELKMKLSGVRQLSPQEIMLLLNHQQATVIDIRNAQLYQKGHILNAINIPQAQLIEQVAQLTKDKPVILVCGNGQQSVGAGSKLNKQGFSQVVTLRDGINAWQQNKLPLAKGKK